MTTVPLLLIVGMHRSGTSLLGSLFAACGIAMPGPLIRGDEHNPEGYFERADVTALQEELLTDFDRWWPSPRGMHSLPPDWFSSFRGQRALRQLIALLAAETHESPWAIKDPRSSLLLPLWQAACQHLAIPLQLVLAVRDPGEVTVSLVQRDHVATGMDVWRAQRLWWHHNHSVMRDGSHLPLRVVHYSNWFDPVKGVQQLKGLAPDREDADLRSILASVVKPQHRRSHHIAKSCRISAQLRSLDRQLRVLAMNPGHREPLQHWLLRQPDLPAPAPPSRRREAIKRVVNRWRGMPIANRVATHPWGYLVEFVCGSQGPEAEHQLATWIEHGFSVDDWRWITALPGSCPVAQSWHAKTSTVIIQVRGGDLYSWPAHAWAEHCPIDGADSLRLEQVGVPQVSEVAINLADVAPGARGGRELLQLAAFERVWDPDPARVQLLRQFGVNASLLAGSAPQQQPVAS
jgi:hypothetical protein